MPIVSRDKVDKELLFTPEHSKVIQKKRSNFLSIEVLSCETIFSCLETMIDNRSLAKSIVYESCSFCIRLFRLRSHDRHILELF